MSRSATRVFKGALFLCLVIGAAGCGTMANGGHQKVPVLSDPAGATVISDCGRGPQEVGTTPVVVKVSRKADRCIITLQKDGYGAESVVLTRHISGWLWGNLFLPYITVPGVLVDLYDGGAYRRAPASVDVKLRQETASLR